MHLLFIAIIIQLAFVKEYNIVIIYIFVKHQTNNKSMYIVHCTIIVQWTLYNCTCITYVYEEKQLTIYILKNVSKKC